MNNSHNTPLTIQLLGNFRLWRQDHLLSPESWPTTADKTLLKILAGERGRFFSQDKLIEHIWPDRDPAIAAANLRRRIAELRRVLEPRLRQGAQSQYILTRREGYCFNPEAPCWIDVEEFDRLVAQGKTLHKAEHYAESLRTLEAAIQLYQGDYLSEDPYAEWALEQRAHWKERCLEALALLAESHAHLGQYRQAIARCRQSLQQEPYHRENLQCQLMLYYYLAGFSTEALRAYQEYADKLKDEEREPGPEAQKLYGQIQQGHVPGIEKRYKPVLLIPHEIPYALSPGSIPFVGREIEYAQLLKYLERARHGQGGCVLISGEAGVGKTRLCQELIAQAYVPGNVQIFQGRAEELGLSYQPWVEMVRAALSKLQRDDLENLRPLWLAEVAKLVPELRTRVPGLPENPSLPPQQEQLRFFEGIVQLFIGSISAKAPPLVLFFDDLHWADEASLDLLKYFLSRLETKPILILGTFRSEEVHEEHPLLKLTRSTEARNLVYVLSLPRLGAAEIAELLSRFPLQVKRPEVFCGRLYKETGGNPLFLIATLQHFFEEGALRVEQQAWVTDIEDISINYKGLMVPPSVKELIARRVSRLKEPERQLLSLASVIGRDVELSLLEGAWEGEMDCSTVLLGLAKAQLVVERERQYKFSHDKVREVVYEGISESWRQMLHQRVLRALEQLYTSRLEEWAAVLAQHAYRAGEWKKALEYSVQALKKAVKEYRRKEGLELAQLGLEALQELEAAGEECHYVDTKRFELLAQRIEIYEVLGRRHEQEQDAIQMQELAEQLGDKDKLALAFHKRGDSYYRVGRYSEAIEIGLKALGLNREINHVRGQGANLHNIGLAYWRLGRHEEALRYYQQALELYNVVRYRQGQAQCLINIGNINNDLGRYEGVLRSYQQALEYCQEIGDRRGQAQSLGSIGNTHKILGQYEEALHFYKRALELFQETGDQAGQGGCLGNIGLIYVALEQYEEALCYLQQVLEINQQISFPWGQAYCLKNIGNIYRELRQPSEALKHYERAQAIFEALGAKPNQLQSLSLKALAYLELNEGEKALASSSQAIRMLEGGQTCENTPEVFFNHYKVLSAHGHDAEALTYLQKAYYDVIQRAEQIKDAKARDSFLKSMKISREIVEAWERHQR